MVDSVHYLYTERRILKNNDFSFSLSESSVDDINTLIEEYAESIVGLINGLQNDLIEHISSANYDKLIKAVDGIIDIYNNVVRSELKNSIFEKWRDACESMTSFSESMEMGDESELVATSIEECLSGVFDVQIDNRLSEVSIDGKTSASIYDFDQVKEIFSNIVVRAHELSDDFSSQIEHLSEENEFYGFLLPIILAYNTGIASYFERSRKSLDDLEESYLNKMESKRDAVQGAKKEVDLSLLLDFSDLAYAGMGQINQAEGKRTFSYETSVDAETAIPESLLKEDIKENEKKSREHISNIGRKMKDDFASENIEKKGIEEILEYANEDDLERHLREFSSDKCRKNNQIAVSYQNALSNLDKQYRDAIAHQNKRFSKFKEDCYKQIEKDLMIAKRDLERRCIKRTISEIVGVNLYQESVSRANQLWNSKLIQLQNEYNAEMQRINNIYYAEKARIESRKEKLFSTGAISQCKSLYQRRIGLADEVKNNIQGVIPKIQSIVQLIAKSCGMPCDRLSRIYQDVYLKAKPSVLGFSSQLLGHKITVNEKKKSWLDSNRLRAAYDGVLNMKTPVHEYLHYLSNGESGTSGVKNINVLKGIQDTTKRKMMLDALTGFNEGITEMFAQNYLIEEIRNGYDFKGENYHLAATKRIVGQQNSYDPQVAVIRSMVRVLGDDKAVRKAYIQHDFSILSDEIDKKRKRQQKEKTIDWNDVMAKMAIIQQLYTGGNARDAAVKSTEIVAILEG